MKSFPFFALFFLSVLFYSCQPGSPTSIPRKKMPDLTGDNSLEGPMPFQASARSTGPETFAFHTSNIDMEVGGSMQGFLYIPLPDASNDSLTITLLRSYKLVAMSLLKTWSAQQHQGVAIDFTSHDGSATHRSEYTLEKAGEFSIPVVIIWDQASASRVSELRSLAAELPEVSFNSTSH
jgi:hypothetical protein